MLKDVLTVVGFLLWVGVALGGAVGFFLVADNENAEDWAVTVILAVLWILVVFGAPLGLIDNRRR